MGVINKKNIIYAVYILLAARACVLGIAPFGIAAYAAALISYDTGAGIINILLYAAACVTGAMLTGVWQLAVISAAAIFLFSIFFFLIRAYDSDGLPFILKCAAALAISNIIPSAVVLTIGDAGIMDVFNIIIQSAVSFVMFFIYRAGEQTVSDIIDKNSTKAKISNEELACAAIMAIVALMGLPSVIIFGLSIRNIISICIIMSFSLRGGMGTGAAAGIVIGIITNPSSAIIISLYAFSGFMAGLLERFGKGGIILAFALGNIILASMLGGTRELIYAMYETGFAAIIFMLLPKSILDFLRVPFLGKSSAVKRSAEQEGGAPRDIPARLDYAGKVRNAAIRRAAFYADTLTEMSSEFIDISTSAPQPPKEDPCVVRVITRVCADCKMCESCWKRDYSVREKTLRECRRIIDQGGEKKPGAFQELNKFCIKPQDVINEMKIAIEILRTEKICGAKLSECRSLIVKQLAEMGKMSSLIAEDIKFATSYDFESEKRIIKALRKYEIYAFDVVVTSTRSGTPDVVLYTYNEYPREKINIIERVISKETGRRMELFSIQKKTRRNSPVEMKFTIKDEISVKAVGICMPAAGNRMSGDYHLYMHESDGGSSLVLSDGMGTGKRAEERSSAAVHMMELYIKSGIDIKSAASMVNMMLTSASSDVVTASLDICRVDRHNKSASFVKMGAMPSLIIGNESLQIIEINQPPAGVTSDISDMYCRKTDCSVSGGECILMFTDGVTDAFKKGGVSSKVFYEYAATVVRKHAGEDNRCHAAAEEILNKAAAMEGVGVGETGDDMSVAIIEIK